MPNVDPAAPQVQMMKPAGPHGGVPQVFAPPPEPSVREETPVEGQLGETSSRLKKLQDQDANPYGSANNHPGFGGKLLHVLSTIGNTAGDILAPEMMAQIPGTYANRVTSENNLTQRLQGLEEQETKEQDQRSQAAQRDALAKKAEALALSDTPAPLSAEDATAIGHPEFEGLMLSPRDRAKYFGTVGTNDAKVKVGAGHDATSVATNAATNTTKQGIADAGNKSHESIADAANKTRTLIAQMHDATSRANNENTNNHKSVSGDGSFKVPADVTKRAALAGNVNENADAVDALVKQHPEIVGASGGRYTTVQQMIGSDDPNIAELGVRIHNIALASNGAHGVRAQGAIEETENNLFNHFKSGPTAIHGALQATRGSMQTFLDDEKNFGTTGSRTGHDTPKSDVAPPAGTQAFTVGKTVYNIPDAQVAEFKKDHPDAR